MVGRSPFNDFCGQQQFPGGLTFQQAAVTVKFKMAAAFMLNIENTLTWYFPFNSVS